MKDMAAQLNAATSGEGDHYEAGNKRHKAAGDGDQYKMWIQEAMGVTEDKWIHRVDEEDENGAEYCNICDRRRRK